MSASALYFLSQPTAYFTEAVWTVLEKQLDQRKWAELFFSACPSVLVCGHSTWLSSKFMDYFHQTLGLADEG